LNKLPSPLEELEEPPKPPSKLLNGSEESIKEPEEPPRPLRKLSMRSEKLEELEEPPHKLPSPLDKPPRPPLPIPTVHPVVVGAFSAAELAAVGRDKPAGREKAVGMAPPRKE
jgi:hypothetical protein